MPAAEVAPARGPDRRAGRARLSRTSIRSGGRRGTCTRGRCSSSRSRRSPADVRHRRHRHRTRGELAPPTLESARARWRARCATAARTSSGSTATSAPGSRTRACRSSISATGQQPLTNETRHAVDRLQRRDLQLRRAARRARGARPPLPDPQRHRSDRPRLRAVGRRGVPPLQRAVGGRAVGCRPTATLVLARDPFGVRPLYICRARRPAVTSPARSRRSSPPSRLDSARLRSASGSTRSSRSGRRSRRRRCSRASRRSSRARRARIAANGVRTARVLRPVVSRRPTPSSSAASLDDAVEAVRAALEHATSLRMLRADVPVGSYLSGGLDSSLVAALGLRAKGAKFSTFSLRFEDAEYDETEYQRAMAGVSRQRPPRGGGLARRHRARVSRRDPPHRAADPSHGARAAVPAVAAGARGRHQGRADRRRRRRDVRRLRPVPRGEGPALLGAAAEVRVAAAAARAALSVSGALAGVAAGDGAAVLRPAARPMRDGRASATSRAGAAPRRSSGCSRRTLQRRDVGTDDAVALLRRRCRPSSAAGRRSRRISTSRCARCCRATCCRRRATGC